jgi:hypothetical protein
MWLLLIPFGLFAWHHYRRGHHRRLEREHAIRTATRGTQEVLALPAVAQHLLVKTEASATTLDYLRHLQKAAWAAQMLDLAREPALLGDIEALFYAPEEVSHALVILSGPMDTVTVQRDLNVLGCVPYLAEDGRLDERTREAVKGLQKRFGQVPTGDVDSDTRVAIRYSVGSLYAQGNW